jgi:hypothetical protein
VLGGTVTGGRDDLGIEAESRSEMEAILRGDAPFTWDAWSRRVHTAPSLTDVGRRCILTSVTGIADYLRADWLDRFQGAGLPLLSMQWWLNDAPHVYARILEFGLRLKLLEGTPGFGKLRNTMANDLGSFRHALLQIEVASLASRDGWKVTLEPNTDSGRADLLLEKLADSFLIEAKGFDLDQTTDAQMQNSDRLSSAFQTIERIKKVSVTGDIGAVSAGQVAEWEHLVADAADQSLGRGEDMTVQGPTGVLTVHPTPHVEGQHFSIEIRHGDEWERVLGAVDAKADQARSGDPRSAHPPLQDHRDQRRELPAPRRQGPDTPDQAGHACGRGSGRQVASDRSAPLFGRRALPVSISIHSIPRAA